MTVTELRKNIYKVFEEVKSTGKSKVITMKGEKFLIRPVGKASKLQNLKKEGIVIGDAEKIDQISAWNPETDWAELSNFSN